MCEYAAVPAGHTGAVVQRTLSLDVRNVQSLRQTEEDDSEMQVEGVTATENK